MMIYLNYLWISKFVKYFSECKCIIKWLMIMMNWRNNDYWLQINFYQFIQNMRRILLKLEKFRIEPKIVK